MGAVSCCILCDGILTNGIGIFKFIMQQPRYRHAQHTVVSNQGPKGLRIEELWDGWYEICHKPEALTVCQPRVTKPQRHEPDEYSSGI